MKKVNWFQFIIGVLLVIFGGYTIFHPEQTLNWIVILYGVTAVITGILDIVFYVKAARYTGFGPVISLVSGIFGTMAGFMLLVYPNAGKWVMIMLLPIWFIAHCVSRLAHLNTIHFIINRRYYYFALVMNIIGIVLGCMMIIWPSVLLFSAGFLIGIYMLIQGIDSIVTAFHENNVR